MLSPSLEASSSFAEIQQSAQSAPSQSFEPQLNVPAFSVFLFIALIFGFLQYRIAAIGVAADDRTEKLATLRKLKSQQLSTVDPSEQETINQQVAVALQDYQQAYEQVENLRTVIPGVARIIPPPADSSDRERMRENEWAAQQFLNVTQSTDASFDEDGGLSSGSIAVLAVLGMLQILLLTFFTLDSSTANLVLDEVASSLPSVA